MEKDVDTTIIKGSNFGKRHVQVFLLFLCVTVEMATRSCMSLTTVAMTDNSTSVNINVPTYNWNNTNVILSSFYWGYIAPQILAGQLAQTYGVKWFLFGAMLVNSLSMMLIPLSAAAIGSIGVMACRIVQGASQGFFFPSCQTMLGRWAPENERSRLSMLVYTGSAVGMVICGPINGFLCESTIGWSGALYVFGGSGILWSAAWILYGFSTPRSHPSISLEEKNYIESSLGQGNETENLHTPWIAILRSMPFWSVVVATVGISWGGSLLANDMNTYLKNIVGYTTAKNGIWSSVPTIAGLVTNFAFAFISDSIIQRGYVSKLNARRIFQGIGTYGPSVCMLLIAFIPKSNSNLVMPYLILNGALASSQHYGVVINNIDISPNFAGIIAGFSYAISSATSLFAPLQVQFLVTDQTSVLQWRIIFVIAAVLYFLPATFFMVFASADVQWWDSTSNEGKSALRKKNNAKIIGANS